MSSAAEAKRFDFGLNWTDYSEHALGPEQFGAARESLKKLFQSDSFNSGRFLDVGCGSGLFAIAAKSLNAGEIVGIDISPNSISACRRNVERLAVPEAHSLRFMQMDVLDAALVETLGEYDYVYAWGSLHHTGQMWRAIEIASGRLRPGGKLVLAIYHRHWTSPVWVWIKRLYNQSPRWLQKIMIALFYPVIYLSKWIITGQNPHQMRRGMNFYYDVVDWIGGYPYEYAAPDEIIDFMKKRGFDLLALHKAHLPTGNNEYVFTRA